MNHDPSNNLELLQKIDFHRNTFVLIPDSASQKHETFLIESTEEKKKNRLFCSCSTKMKYAACDHAVQLTTLYEKLKDFTGSESSYQYFLNSVYWKIIEPLTKFSTSSPDAVECEIDSKGTCVTITDKNKKPLIICQSHDSICSRFVERMTKDSKPSRYLLMNKGLDFVRSEQEKMLINSGHKTQRQTVEDSIWYRLAYHCYRENTGSLSVDFKIDLSDGTFSIVLQSENACISIIPVVKSIQSLIDALVKNVPEKIVPRLSLDEHELLFTLKNVDSGMVSINPCILFTTDGKKELHTVHSKFIYDSFIYLPAPDVLVRMSSASLKLLATGWGQVRKIDSAELPDFLDNNEPSLSIGTSDNECTAALDLFSNSGADDYKRLSGIEMITTFDRVELAPLNLDNESCTISIQYARGSHQIRLSDLTITRKNKKRFLIGDGYIVDCHSEKIRAAFISSKGVAEDGSLTLSRAALLQFRGSTLSTHFTGDEKLVKSIRQMLEFKPAKDLKKLSGYNGSLRDYQKIGVQWLLFLYDNNFGGLLCDDMGLGKTHQVLAFIAAVKEQRRKSGKVLIVCPTTVLSHWNKVIAKFAPSINVINYYNADRKELLDQPCDVIVTSYGILRNDSELLQMVHFDIAVFDEAQILKNNVTSSFCAAASIRANVKFALTGTPIENSLSDLKSLCDLTVPGLLSSDLSDEDVLSFAMNEKEKNKAAQHLQRLTGPFILRRLKQSVLIELPPKIEDRRTCGLSAEQSMLYQTALEKQANPLIEALRCDSEDIPYLHIFALLNHFKQICNHPALLSENPAALYESAESGKWDLFKELIDESLGSGQKVVVFSQYLGMIDIIKAYLEKLGVGHVVLTGASKKRDLLIKRFAEDEQCKVFIGSLKAGGVGIDLVAGSVVIHYDRWWNAARENQATDRVHRIGQQRGVQVFKMVTEGTIEEAIDSIIERKKTLAEAALTEDNPDVLKQFTREDLVELLSMRNPAVG